MKNEVTIREGTERSSKKLTGSLAAKIVAICLVIVSAFMCLASAAAVIAADYMNVYSQDESAVLANYNEKILDRYSVYAMANYMNENEEALKGLDQTNFRYGIIKTDDFDAVDLNDPKNYVISNIDREIDRNDVNLYSCNWSEYTGYDYDMRLFGYAWINNYGEQGDYTCESQAIDGYFYDWMNETLYIKVGARLYPYIGEILVTHLNSTGYTDHTFISETELESGAAQGNDSNVSGTSEVTKIAGEVVDEAEEVTYLTQDAAGMQEVEENIYTVQGTLNNSYLNEALNEWRFPSMLLNLSNSGQYLRAADVVVVDDQMLCELGEVNPDGYSVDYVSAGMATVPVVPKTDEAEVDSYYIVSYAKDPLDVNADFNDCDLLAQAKLLIDFAFAYKYVFVVVLLLSVILAIVAFVFLLCAAGHRNGVEELCKRPWDAIPVDVNVCSVLCMDALLACAVIYVGTEWNPLKYLVTWLFAGAAGILAILLLIECSMSFALWCKMGKWWRHTLVYAVAKLCWKGVKVLGRWCCRVWRRFIELLHTMRFLWKAWLILGVITCVEFLLIVFCCSMGSTELLFVYWVLEKLILYPIIIFALLQMNRLQEGSRKLAQGDLTGKLDTSKMYWEFKKHGDNLNAIGDGMNAAVGERMKSERFKTELITNVSHDIKTPLTSIINYVDLMKKENIEEEPMRGYIAVLDRQSSRLKKLTEDLIEASKAATGNIAVRPEPCDVSVLVEQAAGEYEERLHAASLALIITKPEEPLTILADGQLLWRVLDNLMNNIVKYAMPATRVYLTLSRVQDTVQIMFRNISAQPLNVLGDELMERFVRGDASRTTEGSGLGLSIANSLTHLQGGQMTLTVDGDLFKVTLGFPAV